MKSRIGIPLLACALGALPMSVFADAHTMTSLELAKDKQCTACHSVSEPEDVSIVPSFQSIAQRYSTEASDQLIQIVIEGGEGHWGKEEMPDMGVRKDVTREQAEKLVTWILEMDD